MKTKKLQDLPPHRRSLPARFRKTRILIIGCGDIGLRVNKNLSSPFGLLNSQKKFIVRALTSSGDRRQELRHVGITPMLGNLDNSRTLSRIAGIVTHVIHLAPPASDEAEPRDLRTKTLLQALQRGAKSKPVLIYGSTSAVYGDAQGRRVKESDPIHARSTRAMRRVDAEQRVRAYGRLGGVRGAVLRIPGIYALDRTGGTPRGRLAKGLPVLACDDDIYTSHVHADDLARAVCAALWRAAPGRVYNVSDDSELMFGDYFDLAADLFGMPRPARVSRQQAKGILSASQMSFLQDSRLLSNERLRKELQVRLLYPTVEHGLIGHSPYLAVQQALQ